jgi:ribosome-associated protein
MKSRRAKLSTPSADPAELEIRDRVREAVAAAVSRKAEDLRVLDLTKVTRFADYFLICHGTNERQVAAIADAIDESLRAHQVRPLHVEGEREARWILMDYGDFVVHVFDAEQREFYGLERLWGDALNVTAELMPAPPAAPA